MSRTYNWAQEPARARKAHVVAARVTPSLDGTLNELAPHVPFSSSWVSAADSSTKILIDAFLKRFENVVKAGGKLMRAAFFQTGEDHRGLAASEVEQRLEDCGLIDSAVRWRQLVGVRNVAAHDYADDPEELAESLTEAYRAAVEASRTVRGLLLELRLRYPFILTEDNEDV